MQKIIYERGELIRRAEISEKTLNEWEKMKLLSPDGTTNGTTPFYYKDTFEKILHIKKFLDLGYSLEDVRKIIKKVGLPKTSKSPEEKGDVSKFLTVGELAEKVGVSVRTIKHWEDKGIIGPDMRSEGGFRLYSDGYLYLCKLIKDLQLFGYSLEEIKTISDLFRDFLCIKDNLNTYSQKQTSEKLNDMLEKIQQLFERINLFREGIERWEELMKKKKKEIMSLSTKNQKRAKLKEKNSDKNA